MHKEQQHFKLGVTDIHQVVQETNKNTILERSKLVYWDHFVSLGPV